MMRRTLVFGIGVVASVALVQCSEEPAGERAHNTEPAAAEGRLRSAAVEAGEWTLRDAPQIYVGDTLFELINGGAELYHQHGFVQALAANYANDAGGEIAVEIFEMNDSDAARTIFASKTGGSGEPVSIGDEARVESYYMNSRVGRYVVTITGFDSDPETAEGVLAIGRVVATELGGLE